MKTKITERGQVSIPAEIRKKMGIKPEQELEWKISGNNIVVKPVPKDPVSAFRGAGRNAFTTKDLISERRVERKRENDKLKKKS